MQKRPITYIYKCKNIHRTTHCDTLQHTATHCNTLQHIDTHLRYSYIRIHTYTNIPVYIPIHTSFFFSHYKPLNLQKLNLRSLQHTATHRNTLQQAVTPSPKPLTFAVPPQRLYMYKCIYVCIHIWMYTHIYI